MLFSTIKPLITIVIEIAELRRRNDKIIVGSKRRYIKKVYQIDLPAVIIDTKIFPQWLLTQILLQDQNGDTVKKCLK